MDSFGSLKYRSSWIFHDVLETLLPREVTSGHREAPMKVLALGLNRCGTDSLRVALEELGYSRCYHGYVCQMESRPDPLMWARLMAQKFSQKPKEGKVLPEPIHVDRAYFDRILWDCNAVTDAPAAIFGPELIRAYPEAKVILNRRNDIDAWDQSMKRSVVTLAKNIGWILHFLSWFDAESFWVTRTHLWMSRDFFGCDFDRYGKAVYEEHFERIREMLPPGQYLEWTVQDGWEPLCAFLDNKEVPDYEFPDGNKQLDWEEKVKWNSRRMIRRASRNFLITMTASAAFFMVYRRFFLGRRHMKCLVNSAHKQRIDLEQIASNVNRTETFFAIAHGGAPPESVVHGTLPNAVTLTAKTYWERNVMLDTPRRGLFGKRRRG